MRRNSRRSKNSSSQRNSDNLDELITWGGHEYNHHNLDGIDQQNDVIPLRKKRVNKGRVLQRATDLPLSTMFVLFVFCKEGLFARG